MDWTEDKIEWYIDGEKVRTLNKKILGMKLVIVMITLKLLQEFNFLYGPVVILQMLKVLLNGLVD